MNQLDKVLYTAKAHSTGGRTGTSRSSDGRLEVRLSRPGTPGTGTNPEQLFAAGWSACFDSAMEFAARNMKITLPAAHAVDAEIDLGPEGGVFSLAARLYVSLPGMERATAERLIKATHEVCPYSRATHGNIAVEVSELWQRELGVRRTGPDAMADRQHQRPPDPRERAQISLAPRSTSR
jgi:lipoyl-dependent peroxiredoxin